MRVCFHPDQNLMYQYPEELVGCSQSWPPMPAFQYRELLTKSSYVHHWHVDIERANQSLFNIAMQAQCVL